MAILIPFARRQSDGRLVDASSVPNGKRCDCTCPECGAALIAKHGTEKVSHFAHANTVACTGAYETSLHEAAKQVIAELGFVWLPPSRMGPKIKFNFARAEIEKKANTLRPDVTIYTIGGRPLALEILVTHEVDPKKIDQLRRDGLSCVEFDCSELPRDLTYETLKSLFATDAIPGHWVFNFKADALEAKLAAEEQRRVTREAILQEAADRRKRDQDQKDLTAWLQSPHARARELEIQGDVASGFVVGCPIRRRGRLGKFKGVAFAALDCPKCVYFAGRNVQMADRQFIKCIGHFPKLALQDDTTIRNFGGDPGRLLENKISTPEIDAPSQNPF